MGINVKDLDDISSVAAGDKILTIDVDDTSDSADGTLKLSTVSQVGAGGAGDMQAATYDPTSVEADAFDMDNMVAGTTNKLFTATDETKLDGIETSATADQTGAEIKTAYEAEANTNAYTDAEKSKLAAIEASADVTDATNVAAAGAVMDSELINTTAGVADAGKPIKTDASGVLDSTFYTDNDTTDHTALSNIGTNSHAQIDTHIASTSNPHSVSKSDVGLGSVENTALSTWTGSSNIATVAEGAVTAHQGALSITESQVSDLDHTDSSAIHDDVSGEIAALTDKASPHNNDMIIIEDSEATNAKKRVSIGNLPTGSGMTSLTLSGDSGSDQTLSDGDTLEIAGGTGIDTVAGATDTVTVSVDSTVQIKPTEGGFVDGDKTKLDGIETAADVTDTDNVTAAGALMDSEVDADIKTLSLPASTTISAFGATLVDDADAATARTTLDVDQAGTDNSTDVTLAGTPDYITITGQEITRNQIDLTTDVTGVLPEANLPNASTSAEGVVELATSAETTTGTDTGRVITPDGLAGSTVFGQKVLQATVVDYTTDTATGDGKFYYVIPEAMNGMNLVRVHARVISAGTTGTTDIQIHNVTDSQDMLSTKLTIDSGETGSDTAATAAVINATYDDVATNDLLRVDIDAVSTTAAKGLILTMEFRLP